ncbi:MAG TPA: hypothetical protein VMW49_06140 [Candidatus Dormibacteraeota bacterium]|nr:hypothetical protein [Candidatus Dormibacteraeota bacterium]HVA20974.1 hypothetical protein [Candidatus Micrarchaeia archaeon]
MTAPPTGPTVETVRAQLAAVGVTVGLHPEPGKLRLQPWSAVTPALKAAILAVKPALVWQLSAELRLADSFEGLAVAYERLPAPRPPVTGPEWQSFLDVIDCAYRACDRAGFEAALAAYLAWAQAQLTPTLRPAEEGP